MSEVIGGVAIPDSSLALSVTEYVREATTELLFNHSRRVFVFGALQGERRGLTADPELLYVGAMFHDVGLAPAYSSSSRRFEVDSADAAASFLLEHGLSAELIRRVWLSIALHTTPGIPEFLDPEIALVTAGVETDVLGIGLGELDPALVHDVVARHPRPEFKRRILEAFNDGNVARPDSTFGNVNADVLAHFNPGFVRTDFVDVILDSAWPE
jgi:HD domain